jgi:hypothetical protein
MSPYFLRSLVDLGIHELDTLLGCGGPVMTDDTDGDRADMDFTELSISMQIESIIIIYTDDREQGGTQ